MLKKRRRFKDDPLDENAEKSMLDMEHLPKKKAKTSLSAAIGPLQAESMVYQSLFDGRREMANDGSDGKYEGDFMTRSAKFGLQ